jgi:hypothetical protein
MALRHLLEYEDHEITDLLGDLETVGHADKRSFSLWVHIPHFTTEEELDTRVDLPVALGNPFFSKGSLEADKPLILSSLQQGNFVRPDLPDLDWKTLEGGPSSSLDRLSSSAVIRDLSPKSLQKFFASEGSDLIRSLEELGKKVRRTIQHKDLGYPSNPFDQRNTNVGVVLVYGSAGDQDLLIEPTTPFSKIVLFGERVVLENLLDPDNHIITF